MEENKLVLTKGGNIFKYQNLEYTEDQKKLLNYIANEVLEFRQKKLFSRIVRVSGFAGTGKTTLMTNIFNYGKEFGSFSGIIILAPTNKAKVVLQGKVPIKEEFFSTIHSFIYGSPDDEGNWVVKTDVKNYFVLVDEASMISGDVYDDVVKTFVNSLIVFIGDGFQLEPVGKDIKLLQKPDVLLTEVKRNSGDILDYSIKIRERNKFVSYNEFSTIESISSFKAIDLYVEDIKNNEDVIYIVADNKTRITANIKCRNRLFPNAVNPVVGDRFISIANSKIFSNGETFIAEELEFIREKTVIFTDYYENEFTEKIAVCVINGNMCLVMLDTTKPSRIHKEFSYLDLDILTDLVGSVNIEWDESGRKFSLKREVVICTYGYAIVCHKAQGSQWNKVYVQPPSYKPKWDEARWIYTAITRAISKLIMVT